MTLAELPKNRSAVITAVDALQPGMLRLMVLGVVEQTPVRFKHAAIGGDPIEVEIMGAALSVRLEQAAHIQIEIA